MDNKRILLILFVLVALVQLFVPAKMIWNREDILKTGIELKFRTAPVDPTDPFRGKYITLDYHDNRININDASEWIRGNSIYVTLTKDSSGFSTIKSISKFRPTHEETFIKAKVRSAYGGDLKYVIVDYPFDRFYMEESKAYDAEKMYQETQRDTSKTTYALVNVKEGDAVLKDVLINGTSIREIVKENQEKREE